MRRLIKEMTMIGLGVFCVIYLLNPTLGWIEFIPDVVPIIGNIDEAGATLILINVLKYYGIDLTMFQKQQTKRRAVRGQSRGKSADQPEVIVQNRDSDTPQNSPRR